MYQFVVIAVAASVFVHYSANSTPNFDPQAIDQMEEAHDSMGSCVSVSVGVVECCNCC
jgi:hypothetical protein